MTLGSSRSVVRGILNQRRPSGRCSRSRQMQSDPRSHSWRAAPGAGLSTFAMCASCVRPANSQLHSGKPLGTSVCCVLWVWQQVQVETHPRLTEGMAEIRPPEHAGSAFRWGVYDAGPSFSLVALAPLRGSAGHFHGVLS